MKIRLAKKKLKKHCLFNIWYRHIYEWFHAECNVLKTSLNSPIEELDDFQISSINCCRMFGYMSSLKCYEISAKLGIKKKQLEHLYGFVKEYEYYYHMSH